MSARAKAAVLDRIQLALGRRRDVVIPRDYLLRPPAADAVAVLAGRLRALGTDVRLTAEDEVLETLTAVARGRTLAVPPDFPAAWTPAVTVLRDDPPLSAERLGSADAALVMGAAAIATTGTIVLAGGPGQGRHTLSAASAAALCVVRAATVAATPAEVIGLVPPAAPQRWISGGPGLEVVLLVR